MGDLLVKRTNWDQPCCERCWINRTSVVDEADGGVTLKMPVMVKNQAVERCRWCNLPTLVGIFVRFDPTRVPFPNEDASAVIN